MRDRKIDPDPPDDAVLAPDEAVVRPPSRSQNKRDARAVDPLAARLVGLTRNQLSGLGLPESLLDEILQCGGLSRGARKRQLKRVAGLLRHEDWQAIRAALAAR